MLASAAQSSLYDLATYHWTKTPDFSEPPFFIYEMGGVIPASPELAGEFYKAMFVNAPGNTPSTSNFSFLSFFFSPLYLFHIKGKACFLAGHSGPFERAFSVLWRCSLAESFLSL